MLLALLTGCPQSNDAAPTPIAEDSASPSAAVSAAPPAPAPPPAPPTLTLQEFTDPKHDKLAIYQVEGALMVSSKAEVGRMVEGKIEWIGRITKLQPSLGYNTINEVVGRWPDGIGVLYSNDNGRAPTPTYVPITGIGIKHAFSPGGGMAWISGLASIGSSTVAAGYSHGVEELVTVRGPKLNRKRTTQKEAGCTKEELEGFFQHSEAPPAALSPQVIGATPAGTLIAAGTLCRKRPATAEVWGTGPKSRFVDLSRWLKKVGWSAKLLPGKGDEAWLFTKSTHPILHFRNGEFSPLPKLDRPIKQAFISSTHELLASDGRTIHRYDGKAWQPVAHLSWPSKLDTLVLHEGAFWAGAGESIYRLAEGRPLALEEGCKTPFVYLYDVSFKNPADFKFPSTTKALSTFADAADIELVEVFVEGGRRLGIVVEDKAQGDAVIAHVKREMKGERPELLCHKPTKPRRIAISPSK
jgi:hypothetical protein